MVLARNPFALDGLGIAPDLSAMLPRCQALGRLVWTKGSRQPDYRLRSLPKSVQHRNLLLYDRSGIVGERRISRDACFHPSVAIFVVMCPPVT
jgi:hypothetical protein